MAKKDIKSKNKKGTAKTAKKVHENVEFTFYSPGGMNVYVAGEFNGWDPYSLPMQKDDDGTWRVKVELSPGRYEYKLFADNEWIENLPGVEVIPNPFGTYNFILSVY